MATGSVLCRRASVATFAFVDRAALRRRHIRQPAVPQHAAFDHVHDVEHRAQHAVVGAERIGARDGKAGGVKRGDDAKLAIDGVRGREQFAGGLLAQDVFFCRRDELVSGIGLAAAKLLHAERTRRSLRHLRRARMRARLRQADGALRRAWCRCSESQPLLAAEAMAASTRASASSSTDKSTAIVFQSKVGMT